MNNNPQNSHPYQRPGQKQTRKQHETPWRNAQKSDVSDYDEKPGQIRQIEDSVKNGEGIPYTTHKHTTAGE